jgi:blocked-early-in-transport protein 1|tara:strand:- start:470 stop:739 length:270 start_codon:yes stop_codon:yes gene_type:complete
MENENDAHIGLLAGKVSQLKQLSIDIGSHVRDDNRMLNDLDGNFDSASSLLNGTMKRLGSLVGSKDSRHMLILALFVVFVFLLMWRYLS